MNVHMNTYTKIFYLWKKCWIETKGKRGEKQKGKYGYLVAILNKVKT